MKLIPSDAGEEQHARTQSSSTTCVCVSKYHGSVSAAGRSFTLVSFFPDIEQWWFFFLKLF